MSAWATEAAHAALAGAAFLALFAAAEVWRRRRRPPVEWTRKLVHFGGGLVAAAFPWLFTSPWTVLALAAAFALILWATRHLGLLGSVHGVSRRSQGGLYYPLAVFLLFVIAHEQPVFYLISILALVVSDTVAAVLGSAYGQLSFTVEEDRRTLEGSAVFFLTTFLIAHLPLLLLTDLERGASVLVGVQLALIVTLFEAISLRGSDNVVVPLATYYLLVKMTPQSAAHIAAQLAAQLAIVLVVGVIAWRWRFLTASGAMALMLFLYGAYALCGPQWTVAPALALLGFVLVRSAVSGPSVHSKAAEPRYQVVALFYTSITAAALLVANNTLQTLLPGAPAPLREGAPFYPLYVGVVAAQLALIFNAQLERRHPGSALLPLGLMLVMAAAAYLLVVPTGLLVGQAGLDDWDVALAAVAVVSAVLCYRLVRPRWPSEPPWNVRLQAACVLAAASIILPLQLWNLGLF